MIAVANAGAVIWGRTSIGTMRLTRYTVTIDVVATTAEAKATPLKPIRRMNKGVRIQVSAVHMIMSWRLFLMWPVALRVFVSVVESEAQSAFTPNKARVIRAGCHFS